MFINVAYPSKISYLTYLVCTLSWLSILTIFIYFFVFTFYSVAIMSTIKSMLYISLFPTSSWHHQQRHFSVFSLYVVYEGSVIYFIVHPTSSWQHHHPLAEEQMIASFFQAHRSSTFHLWFDLNKKQRVQSLMYINIPNSTQCKILCI